jgi:hypothetical protein
MGKVNQFKISPEMDCQKNNLPEWTWDDIIKLGLEIAFILENDNNQFVYKELYYLSQKPVKELIASLR